VNIIDTKIAGIPCKIEVLSYFKQEPFRGPAEKCDNDMDYYGYSDIDYRILDRKGYHAPWIEAKVSEKDKEKIYAEIQKYYNLINNGY
jgi:hypothetical protein